MTTFPETTAPGARLFFRGTDGWPNQPCLICHPEGQTDERACVTHDESEGHFFCTFNGMRRRPFCRCPTAAAASIRVPFLSPLTRCEESPTRT